MSYFGYAKERNLNAYVGYASSSQREPFESKFIEEANNIFGNEDVLLRFNFIEKLKSLKSSSFAREIATLCTFREMEENSYGYLNNVLIERKAFESVLNFYSTSFGSGLSFVKILIFFFF